MTGRDGQDGARGTAGDAYTGGAAEATAPVYTIRSLRANLREALATVRETGVPAIIASPPDVAVGQEWGLRARGWSSGPAFARAACSLAR